MKTLQQYHGEFIESEKLANRSANTLRFQYFQGRRLLHWLEERHEVVTPEKLTAQHMEAWVRQLQAHVTHKGLPLRPTSISRQLESDRTFLRWLVRTGVIPVGVVEALPSIKLPYLLPTSVLTHRKMMRLLQSVEASTPQSHQMRAMMEFLYSSGIRASELLTLDVEHVDLRNRQAVVYGKGSKERVVPFGETAGRYVETHLRAYRPMLIRKPQEKALWIDHQGERMPYYTFRRQLLGATERAGLSIHVTAHTFRRSFTTELIRNGANLWHVKDALGHQSVETLQPYVKLTIPDLKKTHARCHPRERDQR